MRAAAGAACLDGSLGRTALDGGGEAVAIDADSIRMMRVREGDVEAFHELFAKYHKPIFNYCFRVIGNRDRAEELTQDAFLQIYRARERYEPRARFVTYLFRVATNLCLNEKRHLSIREGTFSLDASRGGEYGDLPRELPDPRAESAETVVGRDEIALQVQKTLAGLPGRQSSALLLSRVNGMSYSEVSDTLGISVNAVKSLVFRATRVLRSELQLDG